MLRRGFGPVCARSMRGPLTSGSRAAAAALPGLTMSATSIRPVTARRMYSTPPPVVVEPPPEQTFGIFTKMAEFGASLLELAHTTSGLPYWAVIVGFTVSFRVMLIPLMAQSMRQTGKMERIKPELELLQNELRMAGGYSNKEAQMRFQEQWLALRKREDFSMGRQFLPMLIQAPIFVWMFSSISSMLRHNPAMHDGGALWFTDLCASDPFMRLNLITAAIMFITFKTGAEMGGSPTQSATMKVIGIIFPLIYLPLTYSFGQGIHVFWLSSSLCAIGVNLLLRKTAFGAMLGVPRLAAKAAAPPVPQVFASRHEALRQGSVSAAKLAQASRSKHGSSNVQKKT